MQIDPRISFALNLLLVIVSGLATGAVHFTGLVPDPVVAQIIGWAGVATFVLSSINTALHGFSSTHAGPFVAPVISPSAGKSVLLLLAGFLGVALFAAPARVEAKPVTIVKPGAAKPAQSATPGQIVDKVLGWAAADGDADLAVAISLAKASNNTVTLPCWMALQGFVKAVEALPPSAQLPKLHLATEIEIATDLMIALEPNAPVVAQCQALANFQKMSAINMVTGIITGALSLGKLAPIVPIP